MWLGARAGRSIEKREREEELKPEIINIYFYVLNLYTGALFYFVSSAHRRFLKFAYSAARDGVYTC